MNRLRRLLDRLLPGDRYYANGDHSKLSNGAGIGAKPPVLANTPLDTSGLKPVELTQEERAMAAVWRVRNAAEQRTALKPQGLESEVAIMLDLDRERRAAEALRAMAPKVASTNYETHGPRERSLYARAVVMAAVVAYRARYGEQHGEDLRYELHGAADQDRAAYEARKRASR